MTASWRLLVSYLVALGVQASLAPPGSAQEPEPGIQVVEVAPAEGLDSPPGAVPAAPPAPPPQAVDNEAPPVHVAPVYVQPPPPPPPPAPRLRRIDYDEGMPMPEGGVLHEHVRLGLIISGSVMFSVSYLASVLVAVEDDRVDLYLPFVGPFVRMARDDIASFARPFLIIDGVIQIGGVGMLVAGILTKRRWVEYYAASDDGRRAVSLSPSFGANTGLALRVDFTGG